MDSMITIARNEDVALLAEGVDRNQKVDAVPKADAVALLAEGVDRNFSRCRNAVNIVVVALLAEGVDRNSIRNSKELDAGRRPPRGGRG